jgi:small subunit ribosomal protein S13
MDPDEEKIESNDTSENEQPETSNTDVEGTSNDEPVAQDQDKTEPEPESESESEPVPEPTPEEKTEPESESKPEPEVELGSEPEPDKESENVPKPETKPEPESKPEPVAEPTPEKKPKQKGTKKSGKKTETEKQDKKDEKKSDDEENPDFKYIIRVANTNLNGDQLIPHGLTGIKGIGIRLGLTITDKLGFPRDKRLGDLTDEEVDKLVNFMEDINSVIPGWMMNRQKDVDTGEDLHIISSEIQRVYRDDLNRLKKIRSYRGIRHETGQKVRGQRTRANGRTGMTVGVQRRKMQQQSKK